MTSTSLFIRIFGGVFGGAIGTYISGKIYEFIYGKKNNPLITYKNNTTNITKPPSIIHPDELSYNKFKNAKTFSDILEIELKEHISNTNKYNYDYDNEHGNTVDIIEEKYEEINEDNDFEDYYSFFSAIARENN